jgi:hypothetical protein
MCPTWAYINKAPLPPHVLQSVPLVGPPVPLHAEHADVGLGFLFFILPKRCFGFGMADFFMWVIWVLRI